MTPSYEGYRFPAEVIAHRVWLYHRFPLSFREATQLFLSVFSVISPRFRPRRHLPTAAGHRAQTTTRLTVRNTIAGLPTTT